MVRYIRYVALAAISVVNIRVLYQALPQPPTITSTGLILITGGPPHLTDLPFGEAKHPALLK